MIKKLVKKFHYGEKGFTLIELLVVVAILGILAAIVIPNVSKFIGTGQGEAASVELHNVQTAVVAAMATEQTGNITGGPLPPDMAIGTGGTMVGDFIVGGVAGLRGTYTIDTDGLAHQTGYTP